MKNELRSLYKKDKKLAIEAAKVLGYKINVKSAKKDEKKKKVEKTQKDVEKSWRRKIKDDMKDIGKVLATLKTPDNFDDMVIYLKNLRETSQQLASTVKKIRANKFFRKMLV